LTVPKGSSTIRGMMSTEDNVYGTWAGEPANEDNLTPEQVLEYQTIDMIAPYGSENIDEYDYSDGYEH
jgi:hypothetical protein